MPYTTEYKLDLYVDADYAGLYGQEPPEDPVAVQSRTGYVILFCGWPILVKSALQGHLSLSTTEAEYIALSDSLKTFLPLKWLAVEMISNLEGKEIDDITIHASVFEDNQSAFYLATNQRITKRTKYLLSRFHWFWSHYNAKEFKVFKCPTDEQAADFCTKSIPRDKFERNRRAVLGW